MKKDDRPTAYGVFKPVGHVVISFPPDVDTGDVAKALTDEGIAADAVVRYSAEEMLRQIDADIASAGLLANLGQEMNLVKAHRALAEEGYGWLVVRVNNDDQAHRVAELAARHRAERAQHYGRFIIEELIEHPDDLPQVAESPDRGLDAQTPTGDEKERAERDRDGPAAPSPTGSLPPR